MSESILQTLKSLRAKLRDLERNMQPAQIKRIRAAFKMTQEQFAEKMGVSTQAVKSWEQGTRRPGLESLVLLCALLPKVRKRP